MRNFGWSRVEFRDGRVIMGPAREDRIGKIPFLYIEAIDVDGLLYPSYFQFSEILSVKPVQEKDARDAFRINGITISEIKKAVAAHFGFTVEQLESEDRSDLLVHPRWIAFVISRAFGFRLTAIGKAFNRDHGTVAHGLEASDQLAKQDRTFGFHMKECCRKFGIPDTQLHPQST